MSSITNLTQNQRTELRYVDPIQLVHITLPSGLVLYFSDIDYEYSYGSNVIYYDSYVVKISGLGNIIEIDNIYNPSVNIILKNEEWNTYSHLINLREDDEFTRSDISIYEVRPSNLEEEFDSDIRVLLWKGNVKQVENISLETFQLTCCSRLHNKKNAFNLNTVDENTFPLSNPSDRGKYRNKIYGSIEKVLTRNIVSGAMDKITTDLTASQTTIYLSGSNEIPFTSSGQVQIDLEVISYTGITTSGSRQIQLNGCTRGTGSGDGAIATTHDKGAYVGQVLTNFIYEIADHPVSSISNVFVDDIRQTGTDIPFVTYTGQTGSELTGYEGTALVRFTTLPYVGQQVNVDVSDHEHNTSTGLHAHSTAVTPVELWATRGTATEIITAPGSTHHVYDPTNAADEALGVATPLSSSYITTNTSYGIFYVGVNIPFSYTIPAGNIMTALKISYNIKTYSTGQYTGILYNGATIQTRTGILPQAWYEATYSVVRSTGTYYDSVRIVDLGDEDGDYTSLRVYEVQMAVYYSSSPYTAYNDATGVETTKVGTTSLSGGTSTSTIVIGNEVTVDVQGYKDDSVGTYTGTPSALITRPDHIYKHLLIHQAGFVSSDLDLTTFNESGTYYSSNSYNLALVLHDIGTESDKICGSLAFQVRSMFYEWNGKFYLKILPTTTPTSNLIIYEEDIENYPTYSFTNLDDLKNYIRGFYLRDYRNSKGGSSLEGVINPDAMANGYLDVLVSSTGSADLKEDIHLNAIRSSTMAEDITEFWRNYKSTIRLNVEEMRVRWKAIQVGPGDYFTYNDPIFGNKIFRITSFKPDRSSGIISISGIEAP